jgi:hypothetical protein
LSEGPDEETIKQRQETADGLFGCLAEALGCSWIMSSIAIVGIVTVWMI